ncbi:hypothetical protein AAMO2058_000816000 [Amorphochlora amoebiformis]
MEPVFPYNGTPYSTFSDVGDTHLKEYRLHSPSVQASSIVFVGTVQRSREDAMTRKIFSWICRWSSLSMLFWVSFALILGVLWKEYHTLWASTVHGVSCEPLPIWIFISCMIMITLASLSAAIVYCEHAITSEILSIWLTGGGHCLLVLTLLLGISWICVVGWAWVLDSPSACGPGLERQVIWVLPILTLMLCLALVVRVILTLDKSEGMSFSTSSLWERGKRCLECLMKCICCSNCRRKLRAESQPLFGVSPSDLQPWTTRDHDTSRVGRDTLISRSPDTKILPSYKALPVITDRWNTIMQSRRRKSIDILVEEGRPPPPVMSPGAENAIRYEEFSDHFATFFDPVGSTMTQRLYNALSDQKGRLTEKRLRNGILRWSQGRMRDRLTLLFDMWDLNRNGYIDRSEIRDMMKELSKSTGSAFLSKALQIEGACDEKRGNEKISDAVEAILKRFDQCVDDDRESLEEDKDQHISLEEWLKFAEGDKDIREFLQRFTVQSSVL